MSQMPLMYKRASICACIVFMISLQGCAFNGNKQEAKEQLLSCLQIGMSAEVLRETCVPLVEEHFSVWQPADHPFESYDGLSQGCDSGAYICNPPDVYARVHRRTNSEAIREPLYVFALEGFLDRWSIAIYVPLSEEDNTVIGWWYLRN